MSEASFPLFATSLTRIPSGSAVSILRIDHHNGAISLETTFRLPEGCTLYEVDGQGRVIGFLVHSRPTPPRVILVHLDHPGVIVEFDIPPTYELAESRRVSNVHTLHTIMLT